ncbi:oil body-associated protein 1A-like [Wolffia australiana]
MTTSLKQVPGEKTHMTTSMIETATGVIQSFSPIKKIHQHLCAFHFYGDDRSRQVEAHHFCSHQNEELRQCLIYDGPDSHARLIGVEYIVSEPLFLSLPDSEKPLWHSHQYEVKSGLLFMPAVPLLLQRADLEKVCKSYGKTFHFWQVDRGDELPLGLPQIMMALTADGQLREDLAMGVEQRFGMSFAKERENRVYMAGPEQGIHPLANGAGKGIALTLRETQLPQEEETSTVFL